MEPELIPVGELDEVLDGPALRRDVDDLAVTQAVFSLDKIADDEDWISAVCVVSGVTFGLFAGGVGGLLEAQDLVRLIDEGLELLFIRSRALPVLQALKLIERALDHLSVR